MILQGKGASKGVAIGRVYFIDQNQSVEKKLVDDSAAEFQRFVEAKDTAIEQLGQIMESAAEALGEENAQLFEIHQMMLDDEDFIDGVKGLIEGERYCAEYAVWETSQEISASFAEMDDSYMRARAADVLDVGRRVVNILLGRQDVMGMLTEPAILASHEFAPSETAQLPRDKTLALITVAGASNSHTAIFARTMGIPAIVGLGEELNPSIDGKMCVLDGDTGAVIIDPDEATLRTMTEKYEKQQEAKKLLETMKGLEDVTLDGKKIMLYCNIGSPEDVSSVLSNDGQGIGLFRSEFLYLGVNDYPSEESQFEAYRSVAAAMNGKRVVIRTLDIGADKQADYFEMKPEENPALGVRAIRICLNRPEVFRTQLRALYRASVYGKISIMFPMITSVWEVEECKRICKSVMDELAAEGIPFDPNTELGIMIETPASVFIAEELAKQVDFFSVGTNDLTQYTLACDRQANDLGKFYDPYHPALLRAIKIAADAAHKAGIWIGICGELGADIDMLPTFLAMGIDELSVSPSSVLPLRAAIRQSIAQTCTLEKLES